MQHQKQNPDRPVIGIRFDEMRRDSWPSLLEHSTEICPHCAGTGRIRLIRSAAGRCAPSRRKAYATTGRDHRQRAPTWRSTYSTRSDARVRGRAPLQHGRHRRGRRRIARRRLREIERIRSRRDDRRHPQELARASHEEVGRDIPNAGYRRPEGDDFYSPKVRYLSATRMARRTATVAAAGVGGDTAATATASQPTVRKPPARISTVSMSVAAIMGRMARLLRRPQGNPAGETDDGDGADWRDDESRDERADDEQTDQPAVLADEVQGRRQAWRSTPAPWTPRWPPSPARENG